MVSRVWLCIEEPVCLKTVCLYLSICSGFQGGGICKLTLVIFRSLLCTNMVISGKLEMGKWEGNKRKKKKEKKGGKKGGRGKKKKKGL